MFDNLKVLARRNLAAEIRELRDRESLRRSQALRTGYQEF